MLELKSRSFLLPAALLLVALVVRLPALPAALPYLTYVDEGHVLHRSGHLLAARTWEPDNYSYPSLPFYLVAGGALAWSPVYALLHGHELARDVAEPWTVYDVVEPVDLIVIGRLLTLAFSLALVLFTGLLAQRLAGPAAGLAAAWLAAWVPALVVRSAVVNVNPQAACLAVAALFFAEGIRAGEHPRREALLAGAMAGLAGASKYPLALVALPVGLAAVLALAPWRERIVRLGLAAMASLVAATVAMPALVLRPAAVAAGLHEMNVVYAHQPEGSYWQQAFQRAEWDLPLEHPEVGFAFTALAAAGLALALWQRRWRAAAAGWLLFAVATGVLVAPYQFRAFRNLLPLVPLACVLVALLYERMREALPRPRWVDAGALVLPLLLFAPALADYEHHELSLDDSRHRAASFLHAHLVPGQRVLVQQELAFVPGSLARLRAGSVELAPAAAIGARAREGDFAWIVLGELRSEEPRPPLRAWLRAHVSRRHRLVARFGRYPTDFAPGHFKGNGQLVFVLRRAGELRNETPAATAGER